MSYKLKQDSISEFSRKVSDLICDNYYGSHHRMDGAALMKLTDSKQVNAFLVKALFERWQQETEQLQSPFFDFGHEQVKEALRTFMNVVSEHISVARQDLEPLLVQAVEETVLITFDPVSYVRKTVSKSGTISMKYIKTRKSSFKALSSLSDISSENFDQEPPETPEEFVKTLGGQLSDLFQDDSKSFFERHDDLEDDDEEDLDLVMEEPSKPASAEEEPAPSVPEAAQETIDDQAESSPEIPPAPMKMLDSTQEAETINDRFNGSGKVETLADKLKKTNKQSLESSLNLNEKFMFLNSLFNGDKTSLSEALNDLEQAEDYEEAKIKAYKYGENWDMESEEVTAFFEVIERRFS